MLDIIWPIILVAVLFVRAKTENDLKNITKGNWLNKFYYIHTLECSMALKSTKYWYEIISGIVLSKRRMVQNLSFKGTVLAFPKIDRHHQDTYQRDPMNSKQNK